MSYYKKRKTAIEELNTDGAAVGNGAEVVTLEEIGAAVMSQKAGAAFDIMQQYIEDKKPDFKRSGKWFPSLLYRIRDTIGTPSRDADTLAAWWELYKRLCAECQVVVTVENFCLLANIPPVVIIEWKHGFRVNVTPELISLAKQMSKESENSLISDLSTSDAVSVNKIFIAKAKYGLVEAAAAPPTSYGESVAAQELPRLDVIDENGAK